MLTTKIVSSTRTPDASGQITLAAGHRTAMRMWRDEAPGTPKAPATREYETVGFVLSGRAVLHLGAERIELETGDSWLVPAGTSHTYEILESFSAVEATAPPA